MFKTLFKNDSTYRKFGVHRPRSPNPDRIAQARWFDGEITIDQAINEALRHFGLPGLQEPVRG